MGKFYDSVPVSAIVRIRDMMYTVKDPFRLDQGDVSFDAPDTFKQAVAKAIDRQPHALPADRRHPAAAQGVRREDARRRTASRSDRTTKCWSPTAAPTASMRCFHALLEPRRRSDHPRAGVAADDGDRQGGGRRAGAGPAARRARLALEHRRRREGDHAEDARALPQLAEQPVGRRPDARRTSSSSRRSRAIATCGWCRTKPTRTSSTRASTSASRRCPGMYDRTIPVYTLSKSYAITGVRVGYFAIKDQALRDRALKIILYTTSNVSSIAQYGALGAMEGSQQCIADFKTELLIRRDMFYKGLAGSGAGCVLGHAAGRRVLRAS